MISSFSVSSFSLLFRFLLIANVASTPPHGMYLSTIQGEISEEQLSLNIKVFADDWQDALRASFPDKGMVSGYADCHSHLEEASDYLQKHLQLFQAGERLRWEWQTCKQRQDVLLIQVQAKLSTPWKEGAIQADFLMELFSTQNNVVQITRLADQKQCYLRLHEDQKRGTITFDR
ncbi:MAG: DUF6702 family protein [Bacteroidota bacterium]